MDIPQDIKPLLWDVNSLTLDEKKHATYLIERVLEYGSRENYHWLEDKFGRETISSVVKSSRRISAKTANLASILYSIPKEEIQCFQQPFTQKQHRF